MASVSQQKYAKLGVARPAAPGEREPVTEQELRDRVAQNVRGMRTAAGLTVEVAAERAGLDARHWQKIEAAETSATLRTLARLADAFAVDPAVLLAPPRPHDS